MSLHTQDWINIAIAMGTCAAAFFSYRASNAAKESVDSSKEQFRTQQAIENEKWLTSILQSLAAQCNEEVLSTGALKNTDSSISRIATLTHNAIDFVNRYSPEHKKMANLTNFWCFLHSSVWVELKERGVLNTKEVTEDALFIYPGSNEFYLLVKSQYDFIDANLIKKINK
ncbi:hypothetical protein [uncultured Pantoea sp.]|uniref:hypothetical protein n=1 Tax=uncultured Pantoea sp. TaxID=218084 RepID=UPI00258A8300|nr:hypothetical protein [uncultured Pantoea sp.]